MYLQKLSHPLLLGRIQVVTDRLRLLSLRLAVAVLALGITAVQRLLRLLLLHSLGIASKPGVMILMSRLLLWLLLTVVALVGGLLLSLLLLLRNLAVLVSVASSRLSRLRFRRSGGWHGLRLLQMLGLLIVLLREHALLLASKLVLSESSQLVGLVESGLALAIDGLDREGGLLLWLGLRRLGGNRVAGRNLGLLRCHRLLGSDGKLRSLSGSLGNRSGCSRRLSSLYLRRSLVFIQRLGRLSESSKLSIRHRHVCHSSQLT